jgi:hypothetical protein
MDTFETLVVCALMILVAIYFKKYGGFHKKGEDPIIERIKIDLIRVHPKAASLNYWASDSSFTEDKRDMYLCLKDEKGQYYPYNMLMYVALHELAHAISKSVDENHTGKEFNENFDKLLAKASELGIYDPDAPLVMNYCGVEA